MLIWNYVIEFDRATWLQRSRMKLRAFNRKIKLHVTYFVKLILFLELLELALCIYIYL